MVGKGTIGVAKEQGFQFPNIPPFEPEGTANTMIDMHHAIRVASLKEAQQSGLQLVIHKATEGSDRIDTQDRKKAGLKAGLLWGAYHFGTGKNSGKEQADFVSAQ